MNANQNYLTGGKFAIRSINPALTAVTLLAALSMAATADQNAPTAHPAGNYAAVDLLFAKPLFDRAIYANTYATLSASTWTNGALFTEAAATLGAGADVSGSIKTGAAATLGAGAKIGGNVVAQAAATVGAGAHITGVLWASGAQNLALPAQVDGDQICGFAAPDVNDLRDAQAGLDILAPDWIVSPGDIAADQTFCSGVHQTAGSLSVSAGVKLTLDCRANDNGPAGYQPDVFIFNISGYFSVGAGVEVIVLGADENTRIVWNITGTYASIGADTDLKGRILAKGYINTGANVTIESVGGSAHTVSTCSTDKDGGAASGYVPDRTNRPIGGSGSGTYSQTAYVCLGAGTEIAFPTE